MKGIFMFFKRNLWKPCLYIAAVLSVFLFLVACSKNETTNQESFEYIVSNSEVTITKYNGFDKVISIPSVIDGLPVTAIGEEAFLKYSWQDIRKITIPDSVTTIEARAFIRCDTLTEIRLSDQLSYIGDSAFLMCTSLESIQLPASVSYVGEKAFSGCSEIKSISLSENVNHIGSGAFDGCSKLSSINISETSSLFCDIDGVLFDKNVRQIIKMPEGKEISSYSIPDTTTDIAAYAFEGNPHLQKVLIPDSVISIGDYAFSSCSALEEMNIPANVAEIGTCAFGLCRSLCNITVANANKHYRSIDGVLFNYDLTVMYQYPIGNPNEQYTIPSDVHTIAERAFQQASNLTSVSIPSSVSKIEKMAFQGCRSLTELNLPNHLNTIESGTFSNCSSLKKLVLPNNLKTISDYAFFGCSELSEVNVPGGTTTIMGFAFADCTSLEMVYIPDSVHEITDTAFKNCGNVVLAAPSPSYAAQFAEQNDLEFLQI